MGEVRVTLDDYQEQVLLEVVGVMRESGREDLVEPLDDIIDDLGTRILGLVRENTDLDTENTKLVLEGKDLLRTIDILEGVINNEK
jgi:hypothetical protein